MQYIFVKNIIMSTSDDLIKKIKVKYAIEPYDIQAYNNNIR